MPRTVAAALTCLALVVLQPAVASALHYEGLVLKAGAELLPSGSQFSFDGANLIDGDGQAGAMAGVSTLWRWSRRSAWMLVLGADWSQKGYAGERELPGVDSSPTAVDVLADYVSIPVLGRVDFLEDQLTMYAVFGPSLEIRVAHDADPLLDEDRDFALGGNVGAGLEYAFTERAAFQLEGRYYLDFTDSWDGGDLYTVSQHRIQSLRLTAGIRF